MKIDPEDDGGYDDFVVVEDGDHAMRVGEVRESTSADGRTSWMLRMELIDGPKAGKTAVTDWLNFDKKGMYRVRLVLGALGFDVSVAFDVQPNELIGKEAVLKLRSEETQREADGRLQRRSRVPYDGWSPMHSTPAAGGGTGLAADTMPF